MDIWDEGGDIKAKYVLAVIVASFAIVYIIFSVPVFALEDSIIYCLDNETLIENITVYKDGNSSNYVITKYCDNECDNNTLACNPPVYMQNLGSVGVVIVAIIAIGLLWRYGRR